MFPNTPGLFRSGLDLVERTPNSSAGFTPNFSASRSGLRIDDELNSALLPGDGESQIPQTLALAPQSIDLSVRLAWNGVVYQLKNIQYDARISQLKEAIAATLCNETGQRWSLNDLVFVYYGRVLNDAWTVVDCNVPFGSIIHAQERNGAGPRAARQNNEGSVVYTVPAPGVDHGDGTFDSTFHDGNGDRDALANEFSLEDPSGYERMRSEELLEYRLRPQQRFFVNMLANYLDARVDAEDSTNNALHLAQQYHDICHERKVDLETEYEEGDLREGVSAKQLRKVFNAKQKEHFAAKEWLQTEEQMWQFLLSLCELRLDDHRLHEAGEDKELQLKFSNETVSDAKAIEILKRTDTKFRYNNLLVQWFEQVAVGDIEFFQDDLDLDHDGDIQPRAPWPDTVTSAADQLRHGITNPHIEELDPDAPIRDARGIHPDDERREEFLMKGVWSLLRAGKMNQAQQLCFNQGEAWRAASFFGGEEQFDERQKEDEDDQAISRFSAGGNAYRALWKYTCWKLSERNFHSPNTDGASAASYEEAIYAALSGNLRRLLNSPHCGGWKDHCWAYFLCMRERMKDQALHQNKSRNLEITKYNRGDPNLDYEEKILELTKPSIEILLADNCNPVDEVYAKLQRSDTNNKQQIRQETSQLSAILQKHLIAGDFKNLVEAHLLPHAQNGKDAYCRSDVLRFGAHLVLWLQDIKTRPEFTDENGESTIVRSGADVSPEKRSELLMEYISHLVEKRQTSSVALYVSHLNPDDAKRVYAKFLELIVDSEERQMCLDLAERHFDSIDMVFEAVKLAVIAIRVRRELDEGMEERIAAVMKSLNVSAPANIFSRAWGLRWLCLHDNPRERLAAIREANALCRSLLREQNDTDMSIIGVFDLILLGANHANDAPKNQSNYIVGEKTIPFIPLDSMTFLGESSYMEADKDVVLSEYRIYMEYTHAQQQFLTWRSELHANNLPARPEQPKHRTDLNPTDSERAQIRYEDQLKNYTEVVKAHAVRIAEISKAVSVLIEKLLYLVLEMTDGGAESNRYISLKTILIPRLANQLHFVNYETGRWVQKQILTLPNDTANFRTTAVDCIKGSLHVAEILADPKAEFLAVFSSAESKVGIQLLLQKVRQSAVSLFELEQGFSI